MLSLLENCRLVLLGSTRPATFSSAYHCTGNRRRPPYCTWTPRWAHVPKARAALARPLVVLLVQRIKYQQQRILTCMGLRGLLLRNFPAVFLRLLKCRRENCEFRAPKIALMLINRQSQLLYFSIAGNFFIRLGFRQLGSVRVRTAIQRRNPPRLTRGKHVIL